MEIKSPFSKLAMAVAVVTATGMLAACNSDNDDDNDSVDETPDVVINNPDINGGKVLLYRTADNSYIGAANVGDLPDVVKFVSPMVLMTANEGEPNDEYTVDPQGSVSIITLQDDKSVLDVTTLYFEESMLEGEVRIKPDTSAAVDLEPEYVAVNEAGTMAWVTLQENSAVAVVDLTTKAITKVKDLGKIVVADQAIDITDDGVANPVMGNPTNIFALPMPDTAVAYTVGGVDYFVTANEGDDRDYDGYTDLEKAKDLDLSAELEAAVVTPDLGMEKLRVLTDLGVNNGVYEELYMTGTRSFSIYNADGDLVFDSGADFENELAANYAASFNTRVDDVDFYLETDEDYEGSDFQEDFVEEGLVAGVDYEIVGDKVYFWEGVDARSLKKGAEPEALAVHSIGDKVFAYIGMEKQGGFFVYDITSPTQVSMVEYFNDINYNALPTQAGDLAPEGMVAFEQDGSHYLAVAHELSSTLALFELDTDGTVEKITSVELGSFDEGAAEIVDYDPTTKNLYVTNAENTEVDIVSVATPANAARTGSIDFSEYADELQSVSVKDGILAIAVE